MEFLAFVKRFKELPVIDGILINPDASELPTTPDTLYAVTTALGMRATPENFPRIARYAERLVAADRGEFASLMVNDSITKCPEVRHTTAFIHASCGELGQIITGSGVTS